MIAYFSYSPDSDIAFFWDVERIGCPTVEGIDEGVEIAVRGITDTTNSSWIPLKVFHNGRTNSSKNCMGFNSTIKRVRGYDVSAVECSSRFTDITLSVCGEYLLGADALQFRWMGSILLRNGTPRFWTVDSICLTLIEASNNTVLLDDNFDGKCNQSHCNLKYVINRNTCSSALWNRNTLYIIYTLIHTVLLYGWNLEEEKMIPHVFQPVQ